MRRVALCRMATVTALGDGLDQLWERLLKGDSGISSLDRFGCDNYVSRYAACIDNLQAPEGASLLDSILDRVAMQLPDIPADSRLLVASTKGEVDRLTEVCRQGNPIPHGVLFEPLLAKIANRFGLTTRGCNINAACASSTIAVARGAAMIAAGEAESVLVYAADLVSEFVFSGFSALQALSAEPCRPFDQERKGLTLGEAGVALLLMSETCAKSRGESPQAYIAGWGVANDAHHVTAPARDGCGLMLATQQALKKAQIETKQISAINAHGTGTVYNDAMELTAFNTVFGDSLPPLHGVKGSLGHCLGAAGGVEVAIASRSLQQQLIPATVGCVQPEAAGQGQLSTASQNISGDYLLCSNSGFGGINATLILQGVG
ncbi:3-oxoacyl-[acyl-carrier-protein] synthase II [Desulfuromusa kysingii]|uniref:3-oxoacyl-[acyl-carrier-protein] synthase II n=1 Tax=Desulfuromusa kysingii TaxID=37625 RepID=A0A1H3VPE7_9BACT|nr:beta-ketoacyl synthase N-terminal-like domain-containing protein [Desulfuromusa kysingii]SDZ76619.1 3-oxoacyl-[acyl-carrier-protein] synthase II [Desulfuromusa kysingii]